MTPADLPAEHVGKSQENGKEGNPLKPRCTKLQKAKAHLLKAVSYFSGDMHLFGKWMESKSVLSFLQHKSETLIKTHIPFSATVTLDSSKFRAIIYS